MISHPRMALTLTEAMQGQIANGPKGRRLQEQIKAVNRASLANAPPSVRVQVATITNQLDRLLTHAHPSLAFKNIEAAASGYDQQQQNPANPPAGQKQGGAVEQ